MELGFVVASVLLSRKRKRWGKWFILKGHRNAMNSSMMNDHDPFNV